LRLSRLELPSQREGDQQGDQEPTVVKANRDAEYSSEPDLGFHVAGVSSNKEASPPRLVLFAGTAYIRAACQLLTARPVDGNDADYFRLK
jgi:hypothetical protein